MKAFVNFSKLIGALLACATITTAHAAPVVDQDNMSPLYVSYCTGIGQCEWQQTITAGMSGQLTGITLAGSGSGQVRIGLGAGYNTGGWVADIINTTIGSMVDLSSYNIFLTAGQSFVVDVLNVNGGLSGTYTNTGLGKLYLTWPSVGYNGFDYSQYGAYALGYTTYMDANGGSVPEPASLLLLSGALLALPLARRKA